jgi:hypothetical protein
MVVAKCQSLIRLLTLLNADTKLEHGEIRSLGFAGQVFLGPSVACRVRPSNRVRGPSTPRGRLVWCCGTGGVSSRRIALPS